jgi:hypothetical protein
MATGYSFRIALCAPTLLLTAGMAHAGEASRVAERGGFLLGHAYRCEVTVERLDRSAHLVRQLVAALSIDSGETEVAEEKFLDEVLASALAKELGDLLPSCTAIRREFALLEQHQRLVFIPRERAMPNETSSPKPQPENRLARSSRSRQPAKTPTRRVEP